MSEACRSIGGRILGALLIAVGCAALAQGQETSRGNLEEAQIRAAVKGVEPSIVRIETLAAGGGELGPTSGVIADAEGWIVASNHNFAQEPTSILVTLPSGRRHVARRVAADASRSLVLLKIDASEKLPTPTAAPLASLQAGATVVAVGRAQPDNQLSVSPGVVSAVGRAWGRAVQTDAKLSPLNYGGPVVDLQGRVIGVATPLNLDDVAPIDDVELYDSGIGFAAPWEPLVAVLPRWKAGKDLRVGRLGVSFAGRNRLVDPAEISAVRAGSPAAKAGLKSGERIVQVDGRPVQRLAQIYQGLGAKYAGDRATLVVARGKDERKVEVELVGELPPYEPPHLGILPRRGEQELVVRHVLPGSPAATAGIQAGDVLREIDGKKVDRRAEAVKLLAQFQRGDKLPLTTVRDGKSSPHEITLAAAPTSVPTALPPARNAKQEPAGPAKKPAAVGVVPVKLPEFKNEAWAYVPEGYDGREHGLLIWPRSGAKLDDAALAAWKSRCAAGEIILLVVQSSERNRWQPGESDVVVAAATSLAKSYAVDAARIATFGREADGSMAYRVAVRWAGRVAGTAALDSAWPAAVEIPETEPGQRWSILALQSREPRLGAAVPQAVTKLTAKKHAVTPLKLPIPPRDPTADDLAPLFTWLDMLDAL